MYFFLVVFDAELSKEAGGGNTSSRVIMFSTLSEVSGTSMVSSTATALLDTFDAVVINIAKEV